MASNQSDKALPDVSSIRQTAEVGSAASVYGPATVYNTNVVYRSPPPLSLEQVTAAEQRLAKLPLDVIPSPSPLPRGSRMSLAPNPLFVNREDALRSLARLFKGQETDRGEQPRVVAITGLGGTGKSQVASEFAHRYGAFFEGAVFWLSFANSNEVPTEVVACGLGDALGLRPDFVSLPLEERLALVLGAWQSPIPRLLVFDNCEDPQLLDAWRPKSGGCRVVVTSRRSEWGGTQGVAVLPLEVLPRAESVALLRKYRPDLVATNPALDGIATEVGDLALALHLAGSYLRFYHAETSPAAYLAQLRGPALIEVLHLEDDEAAGPSPTHHAQSVAQTFTLSYDALIRDPTSERDTLARSLLARAACLAPGEPIPRTFLRSTFATVDPPLTDRQWGRALNRPIELGLLEEEVGEAVRLHRLVAAFVRQVGTEPEAQDAVEQALLREASQVNASGYFVPLLPLQRHLRFVTDVAQERDDQRAGMLCASLGYHLHLSGDYAGAQPYVERALAITEKVLGPEHPDTATSLNNLGLLLKDQGDYAGAKPYFEGALAIYEKVLGPEHPDTATSLNNLGSLLQDQGDYAGAKPYVEGALAIYEKVLGPEHPDTARSLNNLGLLLYAQGDYAGAKPYVEGALAIYEKVLGPEHPLTRTVRENLSQLIARATE